MLTLSNFDSDMDNRLLQRGKKYFDKGYVINLEEVFENSWEAEVEGSEMYNVEVNLMGNGVISDCTCDCPYNGGICKHAIAVFFTLRAEMIKERTKATMKENVFENLLLSANIKEFQDFIRTHAIRNWKFKTEFELFFAGKDNSVDLDKKYGELVRKLIRKYTKHGIVDYYGSNGLSKEINKLIDTGFGNVGKNNFKAALALARAILRPVMELIEYCDDSNGDIGVTIENNIRLLGVIAESDTVAIDIKEQVFDFIKKEIQEKIYFDYGNFGYDLYELLQTLALRLNKHEAFLSFTDTQLNKATQEPNTFQWQFFQNAKIEFLERTGKVTEAKELITRSMDIVEVRMGEVNKAIKKQNYAEAKKLIAGGIRLAERQKHPGTVREWQQKLLQIATLENDLATRRYYAKLFTFDDWFSVEYYNLWKETFAATEWMVEIEKQIENTIQQVSKKWNSNRNKAWIPVRIPLLASLAPIYIEEKYWDRLLSLLQQENDLHKVMSYHSYLVKPYPVELLAIYLPLLEEYGLQSGNRREYEDLVKNMKRIIKDIPGGKGQIQDLARRLKEKFSSKPRRPAMLEELNKVL